MITVMSVTYSDRDLYEALQRLTRERGDQVISQSLIADATSIPLRTVQRGLNRLMAAGLIEGHFAVGVGYRYRIPVHE